MATNPFDGIISDDLKLLYSNSIEALINGLATPCRIFYPSTKFEACDCQSSPIGNKASNRGISGAPMPFNKVSGCVYCQGSGKKPVETTENLNLAIIWNYKKFIPIGYDIKIPDGLIQSLSKLSSTLVPITKAQYILIATDIANYGPNKFVLEGKPVPVGFGDQSFLVCFWKRA